MLDRQRVRQGLGVNDSDFLLISVGELSERKNQVVVLRALDKIKCSQPAFSRQIKYILVGKGSKEEEYRKFIKDYDLDDNVKLLGFRADIPELLRASDLFVFPSHQEGLPVALMEAMSSGISVICSMIRGNTDLVSDGLFDPDDVDGIARLITRKIEINGEINNRNQKNIDNFDNSKVQHDMMEIYISV